MSLLDKVKRRFARPPEPVRVAVLASADPDERVLAWGALVAGRRLARRHLARAAGRAARGHLGRRRRGAALARDRLGEVARRPPTAAAASRSSGWPRSSRACRRGSRRSGTCSTDAGDLPAVVRRRVDQTVVASQRSPLPGGGGVLLVARRIPGQPGREWTVVFDDDAQRSDPEAREAARQKLADLVAADQPD